MWICFDIKLTLMDSSGTRYKFGYSIPYMSQAFVKEEDPQWLHEIPGTISALINYLTRENNGIRVYEKRKYLKDGIEIHEMSNGLPYSKDASGKWQIAE